MSPKYDEFQIKAKLNGLEVEKIKVDTGADISMISKVILKNLKDVKIEKAKEYMVKSHNTTRMNEMTIIDIEYKYKKIKWVMTIIDADEEKVLFGKDLIELLELSKDLQFSDEEFRKKLVGN